MAKTRARFIEPMLLVRTEKLPEGADWLYEIKLDGYRDGEIVALDEDGRPSFNLLQTYVSSNRMLKKYF
jgi:ATP-dependent DNA ligase